MTGARQPVILVWPDPAQSGDEARGLPADLSDELVVQRWNPDADDGGRADLLASVREARDRLAARGGDPDELVLVGFGAAAVAAAGLARYAKRLGIGLGRVIAVAGAWDEPDPFSGNPLVEIPERVELVEKADAYLPATTLRRT